VLTENGVVDHEKIQHIAEASKLFGDGNMALTSRMSIEITGVKIDKIEDLLKFLSDHNIVTGGTGCRVRPIVSCKGTVCVYGLIDTQQLANEIHDRFYLGYYNVNLPHKFKIAVGGCPNNCVKPDLNDIGIIGQLKPVYDNNKCKSCKKCVIESICPMKAINKDNDCIKADTSLCSKCGLCVNKCPFGVTSESIRGYKIYIGGKWGKFSRKGTLIDKIFSKEEALRFIEKSLLLYKANGMKKERFGSMIDRLGVDFVISSLLKDDILDEKNEILARE